MTNIKIPTFSIITITMDDHDGLIETIESVDSQSLDSSNIENIIINGGTLCSINELTQNANIRRIIIQEPDNGIYDAMNKGIELSSGKYLLFLNSGDVFSDDSVLAEVMAVIGDNSIDFLYGDALEIEKNGSPVYKKSRNVFFKSIGMFTHHQSMFFSRDILVQYDIRYDLTYPLASDYQFVLRYLKSAEKVSYFNRPICIFKQGGASHIKRVEALNEQYYIRRSMYGSRLFAFCVMRLQAVVSCVRKLNPKIYWYLKRFLKL